MRLGEQPPSFIAELPLDVTPGQRAIVQRRLRAAAQMYNRCLQMALQHLEAMRADPRYAAARTMPRGQERSAVFAVLRREHRFTNYDIQAVGSATRKCYLGQQFGAHEAETLATGAFLAVEAHPLGKRGRPRFKPTRRGLDSVEGKSSTSAVRFGVRVVDGEERPVLLWGRAMVMPLRIEVGNPVQLWAALQVATGALRYARLVRRRVKGRDHLYAQLVIRGQPCPRREVGVGRVGADLGPSTIGVVSDTEVALERFCAELEPQWRGLRRLQRRLDRQHRAGSAECFDARGRHRPGRCPWFRSKRARVTLAALQEAHRRMAEHRRSLHGNLVNRILSHGTDIRIEKLSYRAWQRGHFSHSVRDRAPGMFASPLKRKAASAGGSVVELDTRTTTLSQVCVCGRRERKPLALRVHRCPCGIEAQRDVFSALLARHVDPGTQALDARAARRELSMRHDIAVRTASSTGHNRRLGWRHAARTEASVGAGRPHPAATASEAA
jgi:putative transposase